MLKQDVGGLADDLDSMQRVRAKLQLKRDRTNKDLGAGITYYNDDSLEEMLQYYALQVKNLLRDIESRAETKHYKEKQITNISDTVKKKSEAFSTTRQVEALAQTYDLEDILNYCLEMLASNKPEKLENEGKLLHTTSQHKDADSRAQELMNTVRELDAKHQQEVAALRNEFALEKNSILNSRHQDALTPLETIEEVEEAEEPHEHEHDGLQTENSELFNCLEEERKKNTLLEEMLRSMHNNFWCM